MPGRVLAPLLLALAPLPAQEAGATGLPELVAALERAVDSGAPAAQQATLVLRIGLLGGDAAAERLAELAVGLEQGWLARRAVAALAACDSPRTPSLLRDLAKRESAPEARDQALRAIAAGGPDDLEWLKKRWSREDDDRARRLILQLLMDREAPGLARLVVAAAQDDDPLVRAQGLRGIGQLRLYRQLPLVRRELGDGNAGVRLAAVDALGQLGGREAFIELVKAATDARFAGLQSAVTRGLNAADEPEEVQVLVHALGTRDEILAERLLEAIAAASHHEPETCGKALLRALAHPSERVRAAAVKGLVAARTQGAAEALARRLDHRNLTTRADALWGLARLGGIPAAKERLILHLARHQDGTLRKHATTALRWFGSDEALRAAGQNLGDEEWRVAGAAVSTLLSLRRPEALAWLIDAGEPRRDRLRSDIAETLELLTGQAYGANFPVWRRWLADQPADLRLPDPELARLLLERARAARANPEQRTATYHGIPVPRGPVVFVLDVSGSMAARRSDPKETDLRHFARAIEQVLNSLPESQLFDLVLFGSEVRVWRELPQPASPENVADAVRLLAQTPAAGGTNLYDALELALALEGAQTVFLLTDGQPTAGQRIAPGDVLLGIEHRNRDRGVRIHTIAAGSVAADFLQRLAESNDGMAVDLRQAGGR
ncbi:MAG: HEAT repeat domain-containing protein [Planctomycetes bacterium]|nr:HEAT repeat domain-containing protein [Planctomycetota bacterium]MBL7007887.1 HEAT repeat domain-containing protein [Planctomycetota bacterium]